MVSSDEVDLLAEALNKGDGFMCATNTRAVALWSCVRDGSRPPEVYLLGLASNHPVLLR